MPNKQFLIYGFLALATIILATILAIRNPFLLRPFFGQVPPVVAVFAVALLGGLLLCLLFSKGWFQILRSGTYAGWLIAAGLAALLALGMILVDHKVILPADINRPFPASLLFYPTMGFVVEVVFHLLPLVVLLLPLTTLFPRIRLSDLIWPCILLVALLEPIYQVRIGLSRPYPGWVLGYIGLNVFLINLFQLILFMRYDFLSMYSLRLVYYLLWHVAWGYLRLRLLF